MALFQTLSNLLFPKAITSTLAVVKEAADKLVADPATAEPVKNKSVKDKMDAFKEQDWKEKGLREGFTRHSKQAYSEEVAGIGQHYNMLCVDMLKELNGKLFNTKNDLIEAGPNGELREIVHLTVASLEGKIAYYIQQATKNHHEDDTSECNAIILQFRIGFNAGHQKFLKVNGRLD